jgi:hypothetical protein
MTPYETGTSFLGNTLNNNIGPSRISTTSQNTAADGTFHDAPFGVCGTLPMSTTKTASQTIAMKINGTP